MRRGFVAVMMAAVLGLTAACGGTHTAGAAGVGAGATTAVDPPPVVKITPVNGSRSARPDQGVTITATGGTLQDVTVKAKGTDVPGTLSADKTSWKSLWTLTPGGSYQVSATAIGSKGKTTTATSAFRAVTGTAATSIVQVLPNKGETVGIGMPIMVQFNQEIPAKAQAAVEKSFEIISDQPTEGAWRWVSAGYSFNGLPSAIFRPKTPWKANQKVTVIVHYAGVRVSAGVYGQADITHNFRIGDAHTITVNNSTHQLVVRKNGKVIRSWGVSLGTGGDVQSDGVDHLKTTSGVHLTMDKANPVLMVSPGKKPGDPGYYKELVPWATRISNSGEYIHQTVGQTACLGVQNCSHGCVRSPAADAQWFYAWSYRGDMVTITGTGRQLDWSNGWGYWQMSFDKWMKGSALNQSITTTARTAPTPTPTTTP